MRRPRRLAAALKLLSFAAAAGAESSHVGLPSRIGVQGVSGFEDSPGKL